MSSSTLGRSPKSLVKMSKNDSTLRVLWQWGHCHPVKSLSVFIRSIRLIRVLFCFSKLPERRPVAAPTTIIFGDLCKYKKAAGGYACNGMDTIFSGARIVSIYSHITLICLSVLGNNIFRGKKNLFLCPMDIYAPSIRFGKDIASNKR